MPGGGRPPQHDVCVAEKWRERLSRGVSALITLFRSSPFCTLSVFNIVNLWSKMLSLWVCFFIIVEMRGSPEIQINF